MSAVDTLPVAEMFGPTVQGEGPGTGRRAVFVRLWGCNLTCSWCDTPYTWDVHGVNGRKFTRAQESADVDIDAVVAHLDGLANGKQAIAVVTGGEPLIHLSDVTTLVARLADRFEWVEVETNGTRPASTVMHRLADAGRLRFNVSPKLKGSGCDPARALVPHVLTEFARSPAVAFKFVVTGEDDIRQVGALVDELGLASQQVWLMAEDRETGHDPDVAALALAAGWNYTPRLQVALWGDTKGT